MLNFTELKEQTKQSLAVISEAFKKAYGREFEIELFEFAKDYRTQEDVIEFYGPEYNSSCGCHPDYTRDSITIPADIANSMDVEKIASFLVERDEKAKREREEREAAEKREEIQKRERIQREIYEELKKKFEGK